MRGRTEKISKVHRTTFNHDSLASSLRKRYDDGDTKGINSDPIPLDLTIEILTRLPVKSLVRFLCVSKLWSSIIRRRDFINSFLTQSSTRPCLLAISDECKKSYIFSLPHPKDPGEESSSVANHSLTIPQEPHYAASTNSLRGFIWYIFSDRVRIYNPSTRQIVTLPESKSELPVSAWCYLQWNYLGYDPVNDQYKVLRTSVADDSNGLISEHQVFVLAAGNSWRSVECSVPHNPKTDGLCVNGVVYYGAVTGMSNDVGNSVMVSFDVRSEKFNLIKVPVAAGHILTEDCFALINCEGKVVLVDYSEFMKTGNFDLWILEDVKREEWSKMSRVLPLSWRDCAGNMEFYIAGTIYTGEIIIAPALLSNSFYIFYYDLKRSSIRRVKIDGTPIVDQFDDNVFERFTFLDHVENIMFLEDCSSVDSSPIDNTM